jgi:hypothetical protein
VNHIIRFSFVSTSQQQLSYGARLSALRPTRNLASDRVAQLYPQAPGSIFIAFCVSQGYGGGILTRLHTGQLRL